jgi:primosomal protein N' (replication factor Y)
MFVEVAVNLPSIRGTFDYHVPPDLASTILPGHLVTVPFGNQTVQGIVIRPVEHPAVPETRPILDVLDPVPVLAAQQLDLARWLSAEYHAPLIDCLTLMLPPGLSQKADSAYTILDPDRSGDRPIENRIIELLQERGEMRGRQLARSFSRQNWRQAIDALVRKGIVHRRAVLDPPRVRPRKVRLAQIGFPPHRKNEITIQLGREGSSAALRRGCILELLMRERIPIEVSWIYAECGGTLADLRHLGKQGLIILNESEVWRDPLEETEYIPADPPRLTADQSDAWGKVQQSIRASANSASPRPILLHGVTGSGKTEIYLRAVAETLEYGRSALVLVPEIALTPQTVRRFLSRFPGRVGLSHSQLSEGERYDTWRRCRSGQIDVIVGPRSALFLPLENIGLIVLDESHDESYKEQERAPRYHAASTALAYAEKLHAVCLFGSATPDITTTFRAQQGFFERIHLPQRIHRHRVQIDRQSSQLGLHPRYGDSDGDARSITLPPVSVIDMRMELKAGNRSVFSRELRKALEGVLEENQQAILFLNRRGSSTYVFCRDCGWVSRCPRCETALTFHTDEEKLICHHCGYRIRNIRVCRNCGSERVRHFGMGTLRLMERLENEFPGARLLRWDQDATRSKGAHDAILDSFASHKADLLIGTQMIAKGLDLPLVTLVGVISADIGLNMPDFRASERTFQVLTQVSGRAGRGILGGRVILQTYQPDHYVIRAAAAHDYEAFYKQELAFRRELRYPPFHRITRLVFRHANPRTAEETCRTMAETIRQRSHQNQITSDIIGPAPCYYSRLRGDYRWQIILRASDPTLLLPDEMGEGWRIDIDPVSLL